MHSIAGGVFGILTGGVLGLLLVCMLNQAAFREGPTLQFFRCRLVGNEKLYLLRSHWLVRRPNYGAMAMVTSGLIRKRK